MLDPNFCKAYIRRASVLKAQAKFDEALADMKLAKKLAPNNKDIRRLTRTIEAARIEFEYEQALRAAAKDAADGGAGGLPEGAAKELLELQQAVDAGP
jgi:hypothetical protein